MNRRLDKGNGLARWSKAGSTTTPRPPTFACSVRSASMLSTSGGARSGGAARRTSRHGKGSKASRVNGCLLPRSSIRGRPTASASNTRGGSRMREARPYGSERGAFSNGRPYRDRTSDLLRCGHPRGLTAQPPTGRCGAGSSLERRCFTSPTSAQSLEAWIPSRSATRLREADLNVLSKLSNQGLEWRLEPEAFTRGEVGGEDDLLDILVGCPVDIQVARQPST